MASAFAAETNTKVIDVALAWERQKYDHTSLSTVTIIGPRNIEQLNANLASLDLHLSTDQINQLNDASHFELGSPHEIISNSQGMFFGRSANTIEIKHPVK